MTRPFADRRTLIIAFEGWNDAGEAASSVVKRVREHFDLEIELEIDDEDYFDYQFTRPLVRVDEFGGREIVWPSVALFAPERDGGRHGEAAAAGPEVFVLLGVEPSRNWQTFSDDILEIVEEYEIEAVVSVGALLADVPHTRPITIAATSYDDAVRSELSLERSTYEGPAGILAVLDTAFEEEQIPTVALWASVPHYVHSAPSPKAALALLAKLEEMFGVTFDRGNWEEEAVAWERNVDNAAAEDEDMAAYIEQLERARDTVDSPEASGEAIAQEFEKYLRRNDFGKGDGRGGDGRPDDWRQ